MNCVELFLDEYPTKTTREKYEYDLKCYFKILGIKPEGYFTTYSKGEIKEHIRTFWNKYNKEKNPPPNTRNPRLNCIDLFMRRYNIDFGSSFFKGLRRKVKGRGNVVEDRIPTKKELREMFHYASIKYKSIFLIALSSGLRIDNVIGLRFSDIKLNESPVRIHIKANDSKSGYAFDTFITDEAKEILNEYLGKRDKINSIQKRRMANNPLSSHKVWNDDKIFDITYLSSYSAWKRMLRHTGLNKKDENSNVTRYELHIHSLRKFFDTRLENDTPLKTSIIQALMNHMGYIRSYKKYTVDELKEWYVIGMEALEVYRDEIDEEMIREIKVNVSEVYDENTDLRKKIEKLEKELSKNIKLESFTPKQIKKLKQLLEEKEE